MEIQKKVILVSLKEPYEWSFNGKSGISYGGTVRFNETQMLDVKFDSEVYKKLFSLSNGGKELVTIDASFEIKIAQQTLQPKPTIVSVK